MVSRTIVGHEDEQTKIPLLNIKNITDGKVVISKENTQTGPENPNSSTSASHMNRDELQKLSNVQKQLEEDNFLNKKNTDSDDIGNVTSGGPDLKSKSILKRFLGLFLALASTIVFSLNSLVVKLLPDTNPYNICVWSFLFAGFFTLPFIFYQSGCKNKTLIQNVIFPFTKHYKTTIIILFRSITSVGAMVFLYFSLTYLDIGDATTIASSATIFVYFFSWFLLREDLDFVIIATGILAMAGVAVITRPPLLTGSAEMDLDLIIGTALAFGCTVLVSISMIFVRFLKNVHYSLLTFILYVCGTLMCIALAATFRVLALPKCQWEWIILIVSGVLNVLAQIFLSSALQCEQAGHVSLVRTSSILFSFIWQFIFLGVIPDILSFVGAFMIVTGIVVTILRKLITS